MFKRLWRSRRDIPVPPDPPLTQSSYSGAGCIFTDGIHMLGGWQPRKRNPGCTGIGGSKLPSETFLTTAYRETVEELLHINSIPTEVLDSLKRCLVPTKILESNGYVSVILNFEDLECFLRVCKRCGLQSPAYTKFPLNLFSLIRNRKVLDTTEIEILGLFPVVRTLTKRARYMREDFVKDMESV